MSCEEGVWAEGKVPSENAEGKVPSENEWGHSLGALRGRRPEFRYPEQVVGSTGKHEQPLHVVEPT